MYAGTDDTGGQGGQCVKSILFCVKSFMQDTEVLIFYLINTGFL